MINRYFWIYITESRVKSRIFMLRLPTQKKSFSSQFTFGYSGKQVGLLAPSCRTEDIY